MAKFRVKMKLQGLELGIEGSREDASLLSQNIGAQVAVLMAPVSNIIEGETLKSLPNGTSEHLNANGAPKSGKRKRQSFTSSNDKIVSLAIDFRRDPDKYGIPNQ